MLYDKLKNNRYIKDFLLNKKLTVAIIFITLFWTLVYSIVFYKPLFLSEAKILVKDIKPEPFVTNLGNYDTLATLSKSTNPLLNQKEILNSTQLANAVEKKLKNPDLNIEIDSKKILDIIKINTEVGTDIIKVGFKWDEPLKAQFILKTILKQYEEVNIEINNKLKRQRREYIDLKIKEIEDKLYKVREEIKTYTSKNLANNIDMESGQLIQQNIAFSTSLEKINAELQKTKSSLKELESKLELTTEEAIEAVALGSGNHRMISLRAELDKAIQEYQFDSTRLAETNPKLVALQNKIDTIKEQIKEQILLSLGKQIDKPQKAIFDPVREKLIEQLVTAQTKYIGLLSEKNSLEKSIIRNNQRQSLIPQKKFVLGNLMQEEAALSKAFDELRAKQIEAKIKEAETISNISIINAPSLPETPAFPSRLHLFILAGFLGLLLSISASILKTILEDVCDDVNYIEKITGTNILGIIPWIKGLSPSHMDEKERYIFDIAYKNIISNLMVKCYKKNIKVINFTSTATRKSASSMIYNITCKLKKFGHKVILLDTDFRSPTICNCADLEEDIKVDFSDLILEVEERLNKKLPINKDIIEKAFVYDKNGIPILANNNPLIEPYEFFGTIGFNKIISILKEEYDWVLVETSPVQIFPEFIILAKQSDGVIILVNKKVSFSDLTHTIEKIKKSEIPIVGTIVRQDNSKLEKQYEEYLEHQLKKSNEKDLIKDIDLEDLKDIDLDDLN